MRRRYKIRKQVDSFPIAENSPAIILWQDDPNGTKVLMKMIDESEDLRPFIVFGSPEFRPTEGIELNPGGLKRNDSVFLESGKRPGNIFFFGNKPEFCQSEYIDEMLHILQDCGSISCIYTISCIPAQTSHRHPRKSIFIFNSEQCRQRFSEKFKNIKNKEFSTMPGMPQEAPTINLYLAWKAMQRGIDCVNVIIESPFYSVISEDVAAETEAMRIIKKLTSGRYRKEEKADLIAQHQKEALDLIIKRSEDLTDYVEKIENGEMLSFEEMQLIISEIKRIIGEPHD